MHFIVLWWLFHNIFWSINRPDHYSHFTQAYIDTVNIQTQILMRFKRDASLMIKNRFFDKSPQKCVFTCRFQNATDKSLHLLCLQEQLWWELTLKTHPLISLTPNLNFVYTSDKRKKKGFILNTGWKASRRGKQTSLKLRAHFVGCN